MGTCSVCAHGNRAALEHARAAGMPLDKLARRYGLSKPAVQRHCARHIPAALRDKNAAIALIGAECDLKVLREQESDGLLRNIASQRGALYKLLDGEGDKKIAIAVHARITSNLELGARVLGQVAGHATNITNNTLVASMDYLSMRARLMAALRPFPEARRAVAEALRVSEALPEPKAIEGAIEVAARPIE
jgi:hypothetical protein